MRKSLTYKILAAVMALSAANWAVPANVLSGAYIVKQDGEIISDGCDGVYGNGYSFTINDGTIGYVYGVSNGNYDEDASGGNVTINGNAEVTTVRGGYSEYCNTYNNTVNISKGIATYVEGGYSSLGEAYDNTVNISGGSVLDEVYGGYSESGSAHHNTVNISDGSVTGYVFGGDSGSSQAYDNTVNISGGSVTDNVFGAHSGSVITLLTSAAVL